MEIASECDSDKGDSHSSASSDLDGFETVKPIRRSRLLPRRRASDPPLAHKRHLRCTVAPRISLAPCAPESMVPASQATATPPATVTPAGTCACAWMTTPQPTAPGRSPTCILCQTQGHPANYHGWHPGDPLRANPSGKMLSHGKRL
ncbi:unnamed protein product [Euphydryas editha]|uniref:Uncharacterized protein n=1 Tax=Euphydryas editha TaxID=104508 RepID=A0AAU9V8U2_EUPED|nr:unnamed protein product [Euphydryas editha]